MSGKLHALILVAVFSLDDVLFIRGKSWDCCSKTAIQLWFDFNFVSDSKIVAEADVVADSVEDMLQVSSVWCFAMVLGVTETMRHTHIYENQTCERLVHDNLDQQICRAFDGHEKDIGNSAGANSSESTMFLPQIQGWLLLHRARLRDQGHCRSHDHDRRQLEHKTC